MGEAAEVVESGTVYAADLGYDVVVTMAAQDARDAFARMAEAWPDVDARGEARQAEGEGAGKAIHRALCRAARVRPTSVGSQVAAAEFLGLSRARYNQILTRASADTLIRICRERGLVIEFRADPALTVVVHR